MPHLHNIAYTPYADAMLFFTFTPYIFEAIFPSFSFLQSIPNYFYESAREAFSEATTKTLIISLVGLCVSIYSVRVTTTSFMTLFYNYLFTDQTRL